MGRQVAERAAPPGEQAPEIEHVLQACYEAPLARPPGELMRYGAFGYMLLGEIVRRVSGRPFEDFAQERLLGPEAARRRPPFSFGSAPGSPPTCENRAPKTAIRPAMMAPRSGRKTMA